MEQWTHVCIAWKSRIGIQTRVYVDGNYAGVNQRSNVAHKLCKCDTCECRLKITIGNDLDPDPSSGGACAVNRKMQEGFAGTVRDAYLWNRALDGKEIQQHKEAVDNNHFVVVPKDAVMTWDNFVKHNYVDKRKNLDN